MRLSRIPRAVPLLAGLLLAACGGGQAPPPGVEAQAPMQEDAVAHIGDDVRVRASVLPTARLNAAVAAQYGVTPSPGTVLVLVGVRQGPETDEAALPATLDAHAFDLRGVRQDLPLRPVSSGNLLDYVGVVWITPPDSLRFDIDVRLDDGRRTRLRFSRDVFPE
ncbi:DUF4426 domain-containing protein [Lysobacter sp. SG-8]|uniref:DUF4426 domain-containing protein n=1 Tax=Marilutibacter penaei TaxID=2759900 RepID=A0A7W3YDW5_9GAMM|nr:DUF4426 domain-containing protein [Lysobacter penaei]MBB1088169.1 DUF4426 domain-containing protein [Lysobacter penaei]